MATVSVCLMVLFVFMDLFFLSKTGGNGTNILANIINVKKSFLPYFFIFTLVGFNRLTDH